MTALIINEETGLIEGIKYIPSPNFNERPDGVDINLLVIHGISLPPGQFGGPFIEALFTNTLNPAEDPAFHDLVELKVAAHLLIRRTGEIIQFVPLTQRAWHAGVSEFNGQANCNDFSIGIELEGTDTIPYEDIQYLQLAALIKIIRKIYPAIIDSNIVGHSDIAPGRKTDPGPSFDWLHLRQLLLSAL